MADADPRSQRRLVEHQVLAVRRATATTLDAGRCAARSKGLYTAPRFVAKDADGDELGAKSVGRGRRARSRRRARLPRRRSCATQSREHRARRASAIASCMAGWSSRRPVRVDAGGARGAREAHPARAAAPAAQPRADRASLLERVPELPQVACFDTAFHRAQPEVAQAFALPRVDHRARRAALRLPRPVLRVHRAACCRSYDPKAAAGTDDRRAPRQRRQHVRDGRRAAASRARWASPPSTGCRWARAAATSIRA